MITRTRLAVLAITCAGLGVSAMPALAGEGSHFSLLDRPAADRDRELPSYVRDHLAYPDTCDWENARRGSSDVWLIPRVDGGLPCLMTVHNIKGRESAGISPGSASGDVPPTGLYHTGRAAGEDPRIAGAVPDGVSKIVFELENGSMLEVPVVDNTYRASFRIPPVRMIVNGADGKSGSAPLAFPKLRVGPQKCSKLKTKKARAKCVKKNKSRGRS
jgi:hypothetical protein